MSKKNPQSLTIQNEVILNSKMIWLTQQRMTDQFEMDQTNISRHLKNIRSNKK